MNIVGKFSGKSRSKEREQNTISRLSLRLAQSLHRQLKEQAHLEGTSLNQYIVYSLTRQVTSAYTAYAHSEEEMLQREAEFTALRESLKEGSPEEIEKALAKREVVEPEPGLTAEMVQSLRERIEAAKQTTAA